MSQLSEGDLRQAQPSVNRSKDIKARLQKTIEERVSDGGKPVAVKNFRVQNRMMDDCEHTNSFILAVAVSSASIGFYPLM